MLFKCYTNAYHILVVEECCCDKSVVAHHVTRFLTLNQKVDVPLTHVVCSLQVLAFLQHAFSTKNTSNFKSKLNFKLTRMNNL